jgi:hypothetical protein
MLSVPPTLWLVTSFPAYGWPVMASGRTQTPPSGKSPAELHSSWSGGPCVVMVIW